MLKTIVVLGFAAALALPPVAAYALSGTSSSYGTSGYGPQVPTQSLTPFERGWNATNESKRRARESAQWMRRNHQQFALPN